MRTTSLFMACMFTLLLCASLLTSCASTEYSAPSTAEKDAESTVSPELSLHALHMGFVQIKQAHREHTGWDWSRTASIMLDGDWAEWMPVYVYAIAHEDGIILVDTGVDPDIRDPDYFSCNPEGAFFYEKNLRFWPSPQTLAQKLEARSLDLRDVHTVIITHSHGDHVGGFAGLEHAKVYVGPGGKSHLGAFTCRIPSGIDLLEAPMQDGAWQGFAQSFSLSDDGTIRAVELPGHTTGHLGVIIDTPGELPTACIVGDATFDDDQTARGAISGVSEYPDRARATQAMLETRRVEGCILLPSHDPEVPTKLRLLTTPAR